jgi:hypothetical protein
MVDEGGKTARGPRAEFVLPATSAWTAGDLQLLVVRDGSDWLAALPVRRARSRRGVPDPENTTMNRLWSDRRALVSVVATRRGLAGAAAHAKWAAAVRLQALRTRSGRH